MKRTLPRKPCELLWQRQKSWTPNLWNTSSALWKNWIMQNEAAKRMAASFYIVSGVLLDMSYSYINDNPRNIQDEKCGFHNLAPFKCRDYYIRRHQYSRQWEKWHTSSRCRKSEKSEIMSNLMVTMADFQDCKNALRQTSERQCELTVYRLSYGKVPEIETKGDSDWNTKSWWSTTSKWFWICCAISRR